MANANAEGSDKRHLKRLYRNRGETDATKQLSGDVQYVVIETIVGGHRVECDLFALFPNGQVPEPCMALAAMAFGVNTVVGNAVAGKDKDDPAAVAALMQARWDSILDGEWSEGRQGPTTKAVLEAWAEDAQNRGKVITAESIAKMKAKIVAQEVTVKQLLDNPGVQVCYQAQTVRKAQEKLREAQERAGASQTTAATFDVD